MKVKLRLRFKDIIDERGMTQTELAEMTGIRPAAISALVRGYVERLTIDHLERIGTALEITDVNDLITFVEDN